MIKERVIQAIEFKCIPKEEFYVKIGMTSASFRGNAKKTPLNSNAIENILSEMPDLNPMWLISGKGEMINSKESDLPTIYRPKVAEKKEDMQNIPLYDIKAAAGLKLLFAGGKQNIVDTMRIPNLSKVDGAMFITGDSMYPLLKSGDIVVFKQIHNIDFLHLGDIYILAYEINGDEYVVVKYVNKSDKDGHVKLVSYNEHYSPIDIPVAAINTIALVKASVRYNTMQ